MAQKLTQALERYLEAICRIQDEKGVARVKDIAGALDVHKSTVTAALHSLADRGLIHYEPYEAATLTDKGREDAGRLADRHRVIGRFLRGVLNVDERAARRNACRLEQAMDDAVLERMVCFLAFVERCPDADSSWMQAFEHFAEQAPPGLTCEDKIRQYLESLELTER